MSTLEISNGKRNVVLYLNPHLVQEAKDRGINLSRFLGYDLRLFLKRMNQSNLESANEIKREMESTRAQFVPQREGGAGWCGGWDSRTSLPVKSAHKHSPFDSLFLDSHLTRPEHQTASPSLGGWVTDVSTSTYSLTPKSHCTPSEPA